MSEGGIEMRNVKSSNLNAVGYDGKTNTMHVRFQNGNSYTYHDVPEQVFEALCNARSCGSYFHKNVRDVYSYERT